MRSARITAGLLGICCLASVAGAQLEGDVVPVPDDTVFTPVPPGPPQLDERCVVSILNRTTGVRADGTFVLTNVPSNFGPVRARATCLIRGTTVTGQSELFTIPPNGQVDTGIIRFDVPAPIPAGLALTASTLMLNAVGATSQLAVTAVFPAGPQVDVTTDPATTYRSSNPAIATVSPAGIVTAVSGGPVLVTVLHEGVSGFIRLTVSLATTDSDGDGIPDGVETANGLDPDDPLDGFLDPDGDGLSNKEELVDVGTNPAVADSDGDGLSDGEEVRTRNTNPLAPDTDGDGVRDGLEVQTGSDPRDPGSVNLAAALSRIDVAPPQFVLTVSTIVGEASVQLTVTGQLRDGTTIDLTQPSRGTAYASSDLAVCNFGTPAGRVFAGSDGNCTITVTSNGFSAEARGRVQTFAPRALSFVTIPGYANNVDVSGSVAYVASGATGLQVVSVANPSAPQIVGALDTAGNGNDVRVVGTTAYVADGANGLVVVDVTDAMAPALRGTANTPGVAQDVVVRGTTAYVADGAAGLQVIDVTNPAAPAVLGAVDTPGTAKGVDVVANQPLAVVADGTGGIRVVDVSNPAAPAVVGAVSTSGDARDVFVQGSFAFVADFSRSFTSVDLGTPTAPVVRAQLPSSQAGLLMDVVAVGRFAVGADVFFVNRVPIVDVGAPASPVARGAVDFSAFRADEGIGIAADARFVYLTTATGIVENGTTGASRLYIGEYLAPVDTAGIAPSVQITSPAPGATVIEDDVLPITVVASDDIAVTIVDILVDGTIVRTLTAPPYQHTITVPTGVSSLTLGATALDYGNNRGATTVTVSVIPDPGTTVTGRAVDGLAAPIAGAAVTCLGVAGTSAADGTFSIPNVPTIRGTVQCAASAIDFRGRTITGAVTDGAPVRGGTTPVGDILLLPRVSFGPPQQFTTNVQAFAVKMADVNRDGALDLLTPNAGGSGTVAVLLGDGNGGFPVLRQITMGPSGNRFYDVAPADMNGDGNVDLVAGEGRAVSVALGQGDGTFLAAQQFANGFSDRGHVEVGDLDGDGAADVVRAVLADARVSVLLGNGDGTLRAAQPLPVGFQPEGLALGDVDGDGALDAAVAFVGGGAYLGVLRGNGDGTLQAPLLLDTAGSPRDVALADLDGNGALDVIGPDVNATGTSVSISVFFGNGDGTFAAERRFPVAGASVGTASITTADVNRDGFTDVVMSGYFSGRVYVLLNEGSGTLLPAQVFNPVPAGSPADRLRGVAVGTLNSDGLPDIVLCGGDWAVAYVLLQQ